MAQGLVHSGEVELGNIARGHVENFTRQDLGPISQWVIPFNVRLHDGLPADQYSAAVMKTVEEFSPDLIHVWGTEEFWGLFTARRLILRPALLEIQGLRGVIARVFEGGLSVREQLACIGLKEIVKGTTIFQARRQFEKWGQVEREIIRGHRFITVQSQWLFGQISSLNSSSLIFRNEFMLRDLFYDALPWQANGSVKVFCSSAYPSTFKGVHAALRAVALLKRRIPEIQLCIAGAYQKAGFRQDGYVRWLNDQIDKLGIADNVRWLGALSAAEIVAELQTCGAMVLPSFVEGYSLAMAEGMMLGVPLVSSFAGGMPSLARDEESALFFPPGDDVMCAHQLERALLDRLLAERLGRLARETALLRNDRKRIVSQQIEIYRQVLRATVLGANLQP